jgi:hypothetical protein
MDEVLSELGCTLLFRRNAPRETGGLREEPWMSRNIPHLDDLLHRQIVLRQRESRAQSVNLLWPPLLARYPEHHLPDLQRLFNHDNSAHEGDLSRLRPRAPSEPSYRKTRLFLAIELIYVMNLLQYLVAQSALRDTPVASMGVGRCIRKQPLQVVLSGSVSRDLPELNWPAGPKRVQDRKRYLPTGGGAHAQDAQDSATPQATKRMRLSHQHPLGDRHVHPPNNEV